MPTPININGCCKGNAAMGDFHAGRFLREILQEEGHDMAWLASSTGVPVEILDCILTQPNMDAELFVRLGMPLQPLFLQRVDEMVRKQLDESAN